MSDTNSEKIPVTRLTEIFRQAASSKIIVNAHRINAGEYPDLSNDKKGDFFFMEEDDPDKLTDLIVNLVDSRLPKAYNLDSVLDGDLGPVVQSAIDADEAARLAAATS